METLKYEECFSCFEYNVHVLKKIEFIYVPGINNFATLSLPTDSQSEEKPDNSIRVLPKEAPRALTEQERQQRAEDEQYERKIRYNTCITLV